MKTYLVVNPKSANGVTGKRWAEIEAQARRTIGDFSFGFTEGPMHAAELTKRAIDDGHELVVAVGGDGTINEVVNGFFDGERALNPNAAFGVIPRGTGGDFRRTFNWELDLEASLSRLRELNLQPFDLGLVEHVGTDGSQQRRYFANICSFGVSGLVDQEANKASKALGGKLSFMLASVRALLKYKDKPVRFRIDDAEWRELPVTTLSVANGRYFGGGMQVAPKADPHDGLFDVTVWSGYRLSDFALKQGGIYSGEHLNWKGTTSLRCRTLEAQSTEEVLIDCDGEQPGRLPCRMSVLPAAIRLAV